LPYCFDNQAPAPPLLPGKNKCEDEHGDQRRDKADYKDELPAHAALNFCMAWFSSVVSNWKTVSWLL
jgi:hypothetical protein